MKISSEGQRRWVFGLDNEFVGQRQISEVRGGKPAGPGNPRSEDTFDDTIAIIDDFSQPGSHGDQVAFVLDQNTSATLDQMRKLNVDLPDSDADTFQGQIEDFISGLLDDSSNKLQTILDDPNNQIRTINESLGTSELRVSTSIWIDATPEERREIARDLGLPEDTPPRQVLQALMNEVDRIFETSEKIATAKQRYDAISKEVSDRGILHVIAAGNEGDLLRQLGELGLTHDEDFQHSVLLNQDVVTVAASDGNGDAMAPFTTPSPFVDLAIDGTDIPVDADGGVASGTSFASPQVAATIAEMRLVNPDLTNDQIREFLTQASRDTASPPDLEGAGILDPAKAIELARAAIAPPSGKGNLDWFASAA